MIKNHDKLMSLNKWFIKHSMYSIEDVKAKHKGHFFSPDTMRFFSSRIDHKIYPTKDKVYFVTSEKKCFNDPDRVYSVRSLNIETGFIETIDFQCSETLAKARTKALNLAYKDSTKNIE